MHRLEATRTLSFEATPGPGSTSDWSGQGQGVVQVTGRHPVIRFHESGVFRHDSGRELPFRNVYRFEIGETYLDLHHERRGAEESVFLFTLLPVSDRRLESLNPHLCVRDLYSGTLSLDDEGFELLWRVEGPRKDERIRYRYTR